MEAAMEDRDSATYSIESEPISQPHNGNPKSIDDVILPTVRRSAIQIISQPHSPRRQAKKPVASVTETMQITKLVLKTPPGSPKRQSKNPSIMIKSIQSFAGPSLIGGIGHAHGTIKPKPNVLMENRNVSEETAPYRIIPIGEPSAKGSSSQKEFEARRAEREHTNNEFQDFLRESYKENKTPPSTPPPPGATTATTAIEVTRISGIGTSESERESTSHGKNITESTIPADRTTNNVIPLIEQPVSVHQPVQCAVDMLMVSPPVAAARPSLLKATQLPPDVVQTPVQLLQNESIKRLKEAPKEPLSIVSALRDEQGAQPIGEAMIPTEKPTFKLVKKATSNAPSIATSEAAKKKEKSYDPARAREFIREQQAKRRQEKKEAPTAAAGGSTKPASEKDLIKQRLETLRKSSQKLVSNNLQKARKRSLSCAPKEEERIHKDSPIRNARSGPRDHQALRPSTTRASTNNLRRFSSTPSLKLNKNPVRDSSKQKIPIKPPSSGASSSGVASNVLPKDPIDQNTTVPTSGPSSCTNGKLLSTVGSKMGILRKPDSLALEDIVLVSPLKAETLSQPSSIKAKQQGSSTRMVNAQLIIINADQSEEKSIAEAEKELKLDVPDVTLVPTHSTALPAPVTTALTEKYPEKIEDSTAQVSQHGLPIKSIPPWLKQSLQQPDPYPFIVAVRKKLEAVRSVREEVEIGSSTKGEQEREKCKPQVRTPKSHAYLEAIESVPYIKKPEPSSDQDKTMGPPGQRRSSDVLAEGSAIMTNISPYSSSNTTSEISSIKSDIPPPMPPLLCSTRIEVPKAKLILPSPPTIPASGSISPLSIERISEMKIATPTNIIRSPRGIDRESELRDSMVQANRTKVPLAPPPINNTIHRPPELSERSQKELEYQRLLESFNRSLTHVIKVNQQLYSALKKSPAASVIPPFPQQVLRIRDEMTQTSQPVMVIPKHTLVPEASQQRASESVELQPSRAAGSTTTASNYSDDFEHQSQTDAPRTPERKTSSAAGATSTATSTQSSATSSASSSTDDSSSSASSSASNSSSENSSSSSTSSSSNEGASVHNDQQQQVPSRTNATVGDRKARTTSNTTTAQSSDFDSRSFSLSDSHNNTTNNHPPMPEEYLPSFEESLRRRQNQSGYNGQARERESQSKAEAASRDGSSISERIDRPNGEGSFSFKHSEEISEVKVGASVPQPSLSDDSVDKSTLKYDDQNSVPVEFTADATINSDLLAAMFNRTDLEVSIQSTTVSETNLSYSSIGMFDQLINSERSKEEQLVSRVQSKQKALLNRAKGQLAWLELQKQRYREKGMTEHISTIKKKQRAILLRLEKERAELNRGIISFTESSQTITGRTPLESKNVSSKLRSYCSSPTVATGNNGGSLTLRKSPCSIRSSNNQQPHPSRTPGSPQQRHHRITGSTLNATTTMSNSIQIAIRGRELEPNDRLEDILLRREAELRKRKEHIERLLEWHRKLEQEEEQLLAVESELLAYSTRKLKRTDTTTSSHKDPSIETRVRSIEKSLKVLQSIPATVSRKGQNDVKDVNEEEQQEVVKTGGSKLNRLWYRLTGVKEQRYEPGRNYQITRSRLEALYEDAKRCVLEGFQRNDGQLQDALLEQSIGRGKDRTVAETITTTADSMEGNVSLQTMIESEDMVRLVVLEAEPIIEEKQENNRGAENVEMTESLSVAPTGQEEPDGTECELPGENDGKYLLSSTVNGWSPASRKSIESVEFHTLEETGSNFPSVREESVAEEPAKSESYSMTFEEHSNEGRNPDTAEEQRAVADESQPLIEDMSLPPMLLNNTSALLNEEETGSSSCESSVTVELSIPLVEGNVGAEISEILTQEVDGTEPAGSDGSISIAYSLEEASTSNISSCVTTPTTVTPTMTIQAIELDFLELPRKDVDEEEQEERAKPENESKITTPEELGGPDETTSDFEVEEEDVFHLKSSRASSRNNSPSSCASELEKRLATLHDELEELSETFERTPLMKSPTATPSTSKTKPSLEDRTSTDETNTFEGKEESESEIISPPGSAKQDEGQKKSEPSSTMVVVANVATVSTLDPNPTKMEVKLRSKATSEGIVMASCSTVSNRGFPPPPQPGEGVSFLGGVAAPLSPPAVIRMPDIINEAEVLRRQQLQIEQEIKELEQQVGFFREIPNKPPPPYIPPANGSPLALLFPSEGRIDELIDRRVEELHRDRVAPERLRSDHVTNVYEKLILDMCKELYRELRPADPTVSFRTIAHDKRPLVFYNPPDALRCMKDFLRAKVRRVLNEEQLALQQQHQQQQQQQQQQLLLHHHQLQQHQQQQHPQHAQLQHHHLLHHCATMPFLFANGGNASKRKRDQVDEILAQEMHDDDARWTNFDWEEIEVKDRITDELLKSLLSEALHDMAEAYQSKGRGKDCASVEQESAL